MWRADSEGFLQRILSEARARRFEVDVMAGSSSALEPLYRESLLQEVKSPYLADIIPRAIAPHRQWVSVYLSTFVQAYNTNLVRKESLPRTFQDLVRPEWKGKLGIEAEDFDWFAQVLMDMGEAQGLRVFREIVALNGISVRKGHNLLTNLIAAGEVPLALTDYGFLAEQAKRKGAPLDRGHARSGQKMAGALSTDHHRPVAVSDLNSHARPCAGHPRATLTLPRLRGGKGGAKTWMAGTSQDKPGHDVARQ